MYLYFFSAMNPNSFYGGRRLSNNKENIISSSEDSGSEVDLNQQSDDDYICNEGTSSSSSGDEEPQREHPQNLSQILNGGRPTMSDAVTSNWGNFNIREREYGFSGSDKLHIQLPVNRKLEPFEVFQFFVTDDLIDMIVLETNKYASQILQETTLTRGSRLKNWHPTNRNEIKKFLGLTICMGIVWKPELAMYWSKKDIYDYPFIYKHMSRDRFQLLLRFLHFADNTCTTSATNRMYKLQPLLDSVVSKFKSVYTPGNSLVIDESLIPFRGRLVFRQYIPGKAHKYGVKLYKLCTPESYTWNVEVYTGNSSNVESFTHSEFVVIQLAKDLLGCGRVIYADNFYSSVPLAEYILQKKTYFCGTLRKARRYIPKEVTLAKLKKGECIGKENRNGVKVHNWRDKRNVLTLSTVPDHSDKVVETGKKNRVGEKVLKPQAVLDYNKAKKGVDMSDQMSSYHTALRKTKKWYRKVAFELITGTAVVNAWVIYNKFISESTMPILAFKESIARFLVCGPPLQDLTRQPNINNKRQIKPPHQLEEAPGFKWASRKRC